MIDEGELDWKIVAISLDDPRASLVNDADDVEKHFPVRLSWNIHSFLFIYGHLICILVIAMDFFARALIFIYHL